MGIAISKWGPEDGGIAAVAATNMLATALQSEQAVSEFEIEVRVDTTGVFSVMFDGTQCDLNGGDTLLAGRLYLFCIRVFWGDSINFRHSVNAAVFLRVCEVLG